MREEVQNHIGSLNWGYKKALRDASVKYINAFGMYRRLWCFAFTHVKGEHPLRQWNIRLPSGWFYLRQGYSSLGYDVNGMWCGLIRTRTLTYASTIHHISYPSSLSPLLDLNPTPVFLSFPFSAWLEPYTR